MRDVGTVDLSLKFKPKISPRKMTIKIVNLLLLFVFSMLLVSCSSRKTIVNSLHERDANEIIVLLNTKNIEATKVQSSQGGGAGAGAGKVVLWDIEVPQNQAIEAMNYLDQAGLPRKINENLLEIFGTPGIVPSEMQERIRYQAGLAQQIANTIKKIDGVLDASVIISFPKEDPLTGKAMGMLTASVYVRHNGVLDDPNLHLREKIRRLVSASVSGLSYDNVTVIGDRASLTEPSIEMPASSETPQLIKIWSIELTKESAFLFRFILFSLILLNLIFILFIVWFSWKLYPMLKDISLNKLLSTKQIKIEKAEVREMPKEQPKEPKKKEVEKEIDDI